MWQEFNRTTSICRVRLTDKATLGASRGPTIPHTHVHSATVGAILNNCVSVINDGASERAMTRAVAWSPTRQIGRRLFTARIRRKNEAWSFKRPIGLIGDSIRQRIVPHLPRVSSFSRCLVDGRTVTTRGFRKQVWHWYIGGIALRVYLGILANFFA